MPRSKVLDLEQLGADPGPDHQPQEDDLLEVEGPIERLHLGHDADGGPVVPVLDEVNERGAHLVHGHDVGHADVVLDGLEHLRVFRDDVGFREEGADADVSDPGGGQHLGHALALGQADHAVLGHVVAGDLWNIQNNNIRFDLKNS